MFDYETIKDESSVNIKDFITNLEIFSTNINLSDVQQFCQVLEFFFFFENEIFLADHDKNWQTCGFLLIIIFFFFQIMN